MIDKNTPIRGLPEGNGGYKDGGTTMYIKEICWIPI